MTEDTADNSDKEALYTIPLTHLGLRASTVERLRAADIDNVGNLVDSFIHLKYAMVSLRAGMLEIMPEVREKLREHGYWSYVE